MRALVDPHHAGVGRLGENGVALDVAVVLVGDPRLVAEVGRGGEPEHGLAQLGVVGRARQRLGAVGLERVLPVGAREGPLVRRPVVRHRPRGHVDHGLAVPLDVEPAGLGDLADHDRLDVPLLADREERSTSAGLEDGHHPLLRLAHQDLLRSERGVAERDQVERDVHAAVTGAGELGGRAGETGAAEVLDAGDHARGEQLERALDQQLLHERVADLDARPLGRTGLVEGLRRQDDDAADAVAAGARAVQDHLVAGAGGLGEMEVLVPEDADAERVDQAGCRRSRVEDRLAADVGQSEAVAVAADAGHDPGQHAVGVRRRRAGRIAAGPSPRPAERPWPGCRGRCRRRRSPRPGRARRTTGGCATRS